MGYHFEEEEDIKLVILSVLDYFIIPVSNALITDIVISHSFAEYFDVQHYLFDLAEKGLVTYYFDDNLRMYSITAKGKETLEFFGERVPMSVRKELHATSRQKAKEVRDAKSVVAYCEQISETEYAAVMSINDAGAESFRLRIAVPDNETGKRLCKSFQKDPHGVYMQILSSLLQDNS
ncbi:MAG: DUF4364 family protein [Clostridia bacterium]|nr:DUF4364 family protein [Clostridia bacterium]